ncbi:MAG: ribosome biogenesis GTP-binding protein YsxC [Sorangiineae bacterium NIC37A_2]|nr:MAG: ribosome biogenesis GTP-binding protein YsxC [Sorangiineae bacterium NIC37A_2]
MTAPSSPQDRVVLAEYVASAETEKQFPPPTLAEIAFLGRSNVGKSSLMNRLMERSGLVRTSNTPGCTRKVSWFRARAQDSAELFLVDLPGYGYARRSKAERSEWSRLIEDYLTTRPSLRVAAILLDVRRDPEEEERDLREFLTTQSSASRPPLSLLFVATKLDKIPKNAQKPRLTALSEKLGQRVFGFSAETGEGRVPLWRAIRTGAGVGPLPSPSSEA